MGGDELLLKQPPPYERNQGLEETCPRSLRETAVS